MSACVNSFAGAACSALGDVHDSRILVTYLRYVVYLRTMGGVRTLPKCFRYNPLPNPYTLLKWQSHINLVEGLYVLATNLR